MLRYEGQNNVCQEYQQDGVRHTNLYTELINFFCLEII